MYGFAKMFTNNIISGSHFFPFFGNILTRQKIILRIPCRNTDVTAAPVTTPCYSACDPYHWPLAVGRLCWGSKMAAQVTGKNRRRHLKTSSCIQRGYSYLYFVYLCTSEGSIVSSLLFAHLLWSKTFQLFTHSPLLPRFLSLSLFHSPSFILLNLSLCPSHVLSLGPTPTLSLSCPLLLSPLFPFLSGWMLSKLNSP